MHHGCCVHMLKVANLAFVEHTDRTLQECAGLSPQHKRHQTQSCLTQHISLASSIKPVSAWATVSRLHCQVQLTPPQTLKTQRQSPNPTWDLNSASALALPSCSSSSSAELHSARLFEWRGRASSQGCSGDALPCLSCHSSRHASWCCLHNEGILMA